MRRTHCCARVRACARTHARKHALTYSRTHTLTHTHYIYTRLHARTRTHAHAHTHAHTRARARACVYVRRGMNVNMREYAPSWYFVTACGSCLQATRVLCVSCYLHLNTSLISSFCVLLAITIVVLQRLRIF